MLAPGPPDFGELGSTCDSAGRGGRRPWAHLRFASLPIGAPRPRVNRREPRMESGISVVRAAGPQPRSNENNMAKQHLVMLGLLVGGAVAFSACTDSTSSDGGAGAANGEAGSANGEAGAPGSAGSTGEAGSAEAGAAGSGTPMFADALNPQAVIVTAAEPSSSTRLLVAGTDYTVSTEVANLTLATGKVEDTTVYDDGDAVATSSAGLGFVIERTNDLVHLLNGSAIKTTFDLKDLGTGKDAALADKAYVPLLKESLIAVLDLKAGTVSKRIDLSRYSDSADKDGSADIDAGVYDAKKKIAYFLLGRIDFTSFDADFHLPCSTTKALLVGIDATTDEVVDLNGDADGEAAELSLNNPGSVALAADGTLLVLSAGCYVGGKLKNHGIENLDPTTGVSTTVYVPKSEDRLTNLILTGGTNALLGTEDSTYTSHWYKFDVAAGMLGDELLNVPAAVSFDGTNLLGVRKADKGGKGGEVIKYTLATGQGSTVAAKSWAGDYGSAASTALVK